MYEAAHEAGNGFHYEDEATNRSFTGFMNGFHLGGAKAGIEDAILPNVFQNSFRSTKEAAPPEEPELELFSEEPQPCQMGLEY
jgi:hypothetical protein